MITCVLNIEMAKKRMNIAKLAEKSGLARSTISMLYNDKAARIDYATLDKLCRALDCSVGDLLLYMPDTE